MGKLLIAVGWLTLCWAMASCTTPNNPSTGSSPSVAIKDASSSATPQTTKSPDDKATPLTIAIVGLPTPFPPEAAASVDRVGVSTASVTLNTPRDPAAPSTSSNAGFPISESLVGTVYWSNGKFTHDVLWTSSNPHLVSVDASGTITALAPRLTGRVVITVSARAKPTVIAAVDVIVVDFGKVQLDVF